MSKRDANSTVLAVQSKKYELKRVICRENGLMLYGPMPNDHSEYDIVLPQPVSKSTNSAYSLFRCHNQEQAKSIFSGLKETIPYFIGVTKKYSIPLLQEICDIMKDNPRWTLAHLVVHMNKVTLLEDPLVQSHINDTDFDGGLTPIMQAIKNKNMDMVKALVQLCCSLNVLCGGNSVIHFAAASDKEILKYLLTLKDGKQWINHRNGIGLTPIHCACEAGETECLNILLIAGATLEEENSSNGSIQSPLHMCKSKDILESLINNGCNVDSVNESNQTPLHIMALNSNYDCVITLLINGANPSAFDEMGNTPLHEAIKAADIKITKALIVFGADVNQINLEGYPARHYVNLYRGSSAKLLYILHAVGAKRCTPNLSGCDDHCAYNGLNNGATTPTESVIHPTPNPFESLLTIAGMERAALEKRKLTGGRLLCLDGGGIRGLILIQILTELQILARKPIVECFDWVAGTSAGGILALALATGRTLTECRCLFFKFKDEAFKGDRPYPSENIEKLFKTYFGEESLVSSIKHPKVLITGVKTDRYPLCLHLFRNYPSPVDILNFGEENPSSIPRQLVWEIARCTSAAPTYFNSYKNMLDGGLIANNPTLDALTDILEYNLALRSIGQQETTSFASIVVSCGTGLIPYTTIENSLFDTNWGSTSFLGKALIVASRIKHIGNLIVELIAGGDGRVVDRARAWCATAGVPYYRFNPPICANVPLDEPSNEVILDILWETKAYMHKNTVLVKEVVDCLLRD